jgi:hypothetical protein
VHNALLKKHSGDKKITMSGNEMATYSATTDKVYNSFIP